MTGLTVAPALALAAPSGAAAPATPAMGPGYWLIGGDGGVFPFGRGAYEGGLATRHINDAVSSAAVTPDGRGYWLAGADGGVFAFGNAVWKGSLPASAKAARIVAIAATPDGLGYWLADAAGGVYSFGTAKFLGGRAGAPVSAPIVAMAATPTGRGYWLAGSDGAVYAYGDAAYFGGVGGTSLSAPIVSIVPTHDGTGYWLAASDGGVFALGGAPWFGGLAGRSHSRIVGMAALSRGLGYWLAAADGGVFTFGAAGYFGGVGSSRLNRPIVAIVAGDGTAIPTAQDSPVSTTGFDISWPQCNGNRPAPPYGFGIIGVTYGHLFSANPCLATQWGWSTTYGSFGAVYVNSNAPTADEYAAFALGTAAKCGTNAGCILDLWGRRGAEQALRNGSSISAPMWWLDVETSNEWLPDTAANAVILRAMIDVLRQAGKNVGVYSTSLQWGKIVGDFAPGLPTWVAGAPQDTTTSYCTGHSFGGGVAWLAQSGDPNFDTDVLCPTGLANYKVAFAPPSNPVVPVYGVTDAGASTAVHAPMPTTAPGSRAPKVTAVGPVAQLAAGPPAQRPIHKTHRSSHGWRELGVVALLATAGPSTRRRTYSPARW